MACASARMARDGAKRVAKQPEGNRMELTTPDVRKAPLAAPLANTRVLDFGHIVAGPFCVRMLADMGADVVKVETNSREGQLGARKGPKKPTVHGRTALLAQINRSRR